MRPVPDRPNLRRLAGPLAVLLALGLAFASAFAAVKPKVESPHGKLKEECSTCHTASTWKIAKIKSSFDHGKYGFKLAGAHAATACTSCHGTLEFAAAPAQCVTCHKDPHRGEMGTECARCHGDRSFVDRGPMVRAHQLTRFPLTGGHAALDCESCHKPAAQGQMQFVGTRAQCQDCHMAQYQSVKEPDHVAGHYPLECQTCHTTVSWSGAKFDHDATGFPLTGSHRTTACASCHTNGRFAGTPRDCASCHQTQYDAATPPHPAAGFAASACASCHNTTQWAGATFDHNTTSFPLTGAHRTAACSGCHSDGVYKGKATACYSCHTTDYTGASPQHTAGSFPPAQCATCHTTTSWSGAIFNHSNTAFPLTGAHTTTACASCHVGGVYAGTAKECQGCHMTQYNAATPPHPAAGFAANACASCHTTVQWAGATFDHNTTSFPLTGAHRGATCNSCHSDGVYNGKPTDCYSCHQGDYSGASPQHTAGSFPPAQCATCHNTTSWDGANFNHSNTAFPLTGAHTTTACASCHVGGVYAGTSKECQGCHMTQYNAATPNHLSAGFAASACASCHTTVQWAGATFDHNTTSFPLTGAHRTVSCNDCHSDGVYNGKPTDCYSCHQSDYTGASPKHTATSFPPAQCATCHTTTSWDNANFNHNNTAFPLTGAHTTTACASCHVGGVYAGTSKDCQGCHMTDYNGASPDHAASGFAASACATCHTTTQWAGATFDHDGPWFPIYSGRHKGKWDACSDCHTSPTNYAQFACYGACHNVSSVDRDHTGVRNYVQGAGNSAQCYSCHPTGRAG